MKKLLSWTKAHPLNSALLTATVAAWVLVAAQTNYLGTVFLGDPTTPSQQAAVSAQGEVKVNCTSGCASWVGFPTGATAITGNAAGSTGAVVGSLAGVSAKTTYLCGFDVSAIGGTAAVGPVTVAGLVGSSMVYQLSSAALGVTLSRGFTPCVPASATNTAITVTTTADGSASAVDVNSWGYQQ